MTFSRRAFLGAAAVTAGLGGLRALLASDRRGALAVTDRFGPLVPDPAGILDLPAGFRYRIFSRAGERMDDGLVVPGLHDGMATFPGPDGLTLLIRNHEANWGDPPAKSAFGDALQHLGRVPADRLYDPGIGGGPAQGGTTTLLFDTRTQQLRAHKLSLAGTLRNCAGGPTPWGSWISCEETLDRAGDGRARDHGYNFEVPARWDAPLAEPVPLVAMGRFNHEAVAVDPASGIVYQTEDDGAGLLYRFIPDVPGELARGGRLQALALADTPSADTRNWDAARIAPGQPHPVSWVDLDEVHAPAGDLRLRGFAAGAARFARGEGMWRGDDGIYFACTNGGPARLGQIWRYRPSPAEGTPAEGATPGTVELFVEPNDSTLVEHADNLTIAPWGDLVVCEDGTGDDYLVGITPEGTLYRLGHNRTGNGEFAGACFARDGSTFFVNMQFQGWTFAITGPWEGSRG